MQLSSQRLDRARGTADWGVAMKGSARHRHAGRARSAAATALCIASAVSAAGATPVLGTPTHSLVGTERYFGAQPPTPADCAAQGFRCFTPRAIQNTYDLP